MQLYDTLLGLPLFQGMSSSELEEVVTRIKMGFLKYKRNQTIIQDGDRCQRLLFLLDGEMDVVTTSANHSYHVIEQIAGPSLIEPERVFGLTQHYAHTYTTRSLCHLLAIGKDDVIQLTNEYMIFRINLMNILSTQSQRQQRMLWQHRPQTVRGRVVQFLRQHCTMPSGRKVFRIKMQQLADEINDQRIEVSEVLNALDDEKMIELQRGIITIPNLIALA